MVLNIQSNAVSLPLLPHALLSQRMEMVIGCIQKVLKTHSVQNVFGF